MTRKGHRDYRPGDRAAGYVRVSTERQAGEGVSLAAQESKIIAMCQLQDARLLEVVRDEGASGKSLERPGLARLLGLVDERAVDVVVIAKLDRLTRSVRDLADLLERFARKHVALISVAESLDTGTAAGRLVLNVMTSVAQWEREAISERTRDALRHKAANGFRVGEVRYGYRLAADGKRLEPDVDEQRALTRMHELRANGLTCRQIADAMFAEGFLTRRGTRWRFQYVAERLRRE